MGLTGVHLITAGHRRPSQANKATSPRLHPISSNICGEIYTSNGASTAAGPASRQTPAMVSKRLAMFPLMVCIWVQVACACATISVSHQSLQ